MFKPKGDWDESHMDICRVNNELTWIALMFMNRGEHSEQLGHLYCTQKIPNEDKNAPSHHFSIA